MTSGYASFDYEIIEHREGDLVKLGILVNSEPVDALAMMIHKDFAQKTGREVCEKLKDLIPRHNFMIPVDRKSTRLNSSHSQQSRMPSSA